MQVSNLRELHAPGPIAPSTGPAFVGCVGLRHHGETRVWGGAPPLWMMQAVCKPCSLEWPEAHTARAWLPRCRAAMALAGD